MIAYLDSSALVKLFLDEAGSDVARDVWDSGAPLATSRVSHAELACALAAAIRSGRYRRAAVDPDVIDGAFLRGRAYLVEADSDVVDSAAVIGVKHSLRGMDSIHVASAIGLRAFDPLLVSWDHRQRYAADAEGIAVYPDTTTAALR
ncbi:MAG: type II toxin-antitoxin system VapC family toxin [Thermoleophilia bacterium]|nr:type II toxin-antitoxin system VapC family toxin [Thermoleophilia bacterium]